MITASPIGTVIERLDGIERHGSQIAAKCPAHDDRTASLSIAEGDDGRVLLNCHAGCDTRAIVSALGLQMSDLFPPRTGASPASPTTKTKKTPTIHRSADRAIGAAEWSIEQKLGKTPQRAGEWVYHNLDRSEFARMVRFDLGDEKKEFRPVHSVAGGWQVGDPKGKFPLYRLPDICDAETVWIGEGEKCADALASLGLAGTTSAHGAKSPKKTDWSPLAGKTVVILPDRDPAGERYAHEVSERLYAMRCKVKIIRIDHPCGETPSGFDIADWVDYYDSRSDKELRDTLLELARNTDEIPPPSPGRDESMPSDRATELANAEEFGRQHGESLRFNTSRNAWHVYTRGYWPIDTTGQVHRWAKEVAKSSASRLADVVEFKTLDKFTRAMESARGISAVIKLLETEPGISVSANDFDRDDFLLNLVNGTLDLRTGKLRDHSPGDLITYQLATPFDASARCPIWESVVRRSMGGHDGLITYLQRWAGLFLTGSPNVHELLIAYGSGANGKSVIFDTLTGMLEDLAGVAPESLLIARHGQPEHPTEIADLKGKRLVIASETESGATLRLQLVKRLTGDATLKGRYMRCDYIEFPRTHKLVLITNNRPRLTESTEAVWRRLRLLPFDVVIPPEERDPQLLQKLRHEWPGILAWCVRGCLDWQRNGMNPPPEVLVATDEYKAEADDLADFIATKCIVGDPETFRASRADLFATYSAWAKATNERRPMDRTQLYEAIRRRDGISDSQWKVSGLTAPVRGFRGIAVCSGEEGSRL